MSSVFFFFNDTATTEIYTLSLHDALPISGKYHPGAMLAVWGGIYCDAVCRALWFETIRPCTQRRSRDRKSTRLNSSHVRISYAVFCLEKKTTLESRLDAVMSQMQSDYSQA